MIVLKSTHEALRRNFESLQRDTERVRERIRDLERDHDELLRFLRLCRNATPGLRKLSDKEIELQELQEQQEAIAAAHARAYRGVA